jgi:hypothetical protein
MKRPIGVTQSPRPAYPSHEWTMAKADRHHSMGRTVSLSDARALLLRSYQSTGLVEKKVLTALEEGRVQSSRIREDGTRDELDRAFWRSELDYPGCVTHLYVNWSENSAHHGYLFFVLGTFKELPALPEPAYAITLSLADVLALLPAAADVAGKTPRRGRPRTYDHDAIRDAGETVAKRGLPDLKDLFFEKVRDLCRDRHIKVPDDDTQLRRIVGPIYDREA